MGTVVFIPVVQNKEWGSVHPWGDHVNNWYNTTDYYAITIYFRGYGYTKGIPTNQHKKLRRWMEKNLNGEILIGITNHISSGYVELIAYFELESDATAFKLTWE